MASGDGMVHSVDEFRIARFDSGRDLLIMAESSKNESIRAVTLVGSVSRRAGGMFDAIRLLCRNLAEREKVSMEVVSLRDDRTESDLDAWQPLRPKALPTRGPLALGYSPETGPALAASSPDLIHAHGLWLLLSMASHRHARRTGTPYLISPHGMLDPWAIHHSPWKKRLAGVLFERRHLRDAGCLHALCRAEADAIRRFGLTNPVCVIPNGIDLSSDKPAAPLPPPPWAGKIPGGAPVLLYLGRIHPKKGLPNLIRAWAMGNASRGEWHLVVAGWDQGGHEAELKRLVNDLGVGDRVWFAGPQFDQARDSCYRHASAFVLPSMSEGLPVVVLEAWACRLPVLITPACNLPEGLEAGAAIGIDCDAGGIAAGIARLLEMGAEERTAMGSKGRQLVEERFTWPIIARNMRRVYDHLLAGDLKEGDLLEWTR